MKRIRQTATRNTRNRMVRSKVRTYAKKVRTAVQEGNLETAQASLKEAGKYWAKAATKGVYKKKTASRSISRLAKAVNKLQANS